LKEEIMKVCHHTLTLREFKINIEALKEKMIKIEASLTGMIIITRKIKLTYLSKDQIIQIMISMYMIKEGMTMMNDSLEKVHQQCPKTG